MTYTIGSGAQKDIQPGDILLLLPGLLERNAFDVSAVVAADVSSSSALVILQLDGHGVTFGEPITLTPGWILDVWRRLA